jgi:hypothetical protein
MRFLALLLMLCAPLLAHAQVIVGDAISAKDLKLARDTLERATPKTLTLEPGEFEIIEPAQALKQPLLWLTSDDTLLQRIDVAANQPLGLWMKRRGESSAKLHQFPAKPFAWVIVVGAKPGSVALTIIRNGENQTAPVVVDTLIITLGGIPPPPPTPIDDAFTKSLRLALQQDQQSGLFEKRWLLALAGIYATASRNELTAIKTVGDLDALLITARQAAGIPEPEKMLPTIRQRLRQELLTQLNVTDADAGKPLTSERKQLARQTLARIAHTLEVIHP